MTPTDPRASPPSLADQMADAAALMAVAREAGIAVEADKFGRGTFLFSNVACLRRILDAAKSAALSEVLGDERASEPVAKIKPSQKSMRELLSEAALGDSQCSMLNSAIYAIAKAVPATVDSTGGAIYLQTQPASPARELTDAELTAIGAKHLEACAQFVGAGEVWVEGEVEFARAVIAADRALREQGR